MRILFLNYEYPPLGGGAGNASEFLLKEFSKEASIEVDAVVSSADGKFHEELLGKNIRLYRIPIGNKQNSLKSQTSKDLLLYAWRASALCERLIKEKKYDGIHAFFTVPCGAVAWRLHAKHRIPYIVSLRGSDVPGYSRKYEKIYFFIKPLVRKIWKWASSVVSNSRGLKDLALQTDASCDVKVIFNGVDTDAFLLRSPRSDGEFRILCASRLEKRKGFRYVIEAVAFLKDRYPNVRLILAGGDGNAGEELRSLVREKNLSSSVTFFGQYTREELSVLQSTSDIFVLPSFNEGMSNSLLEAMAGGLPVLMTPTGGADELIHEGKNGYIIHFSDAAEIAQKLELFLEHPEKVSEMGKESRCAAESMRWSSVANAYREEYEKYFKG